MKGLLIIGTGGIAKNVLDCAERYTKIAFMTNNPNAKKIGDFPLLYEQETSIDYILENFDDVIVAVGDNKYRLCMMEQYSSCGLKIPTIIHPTAIISKYAEIDYGSIICENGSVGPFAKVGKATIVSHKVLVSHDCKLDDGVRTSAGAIIAGRCTIGEKTWICIGASVSTDIKIGANSVIGAGAVVLKDIPDNVLAVGIPAEIVKKYD